MKSILIVKTSSLGDIIQSFAALEYLKKRYPSAKIDWAVESAFQDLVKSHPVIDAVHVFDTKTWRKNLFSLRTWKEIVRVFRKMKAYDLIVDLQGNSKSGSITRFVKSPIKIGFGLKSVKEWPNLLATNRRYNVDQTRPISHHYLELLQQFHRDGNPFSPPERLLKLSDDGKQTINGVISQRELIRPLRIMICPHSNWKNKELSLGCLRDFLSRVSKAQPVSFLFIWSNSKEKQVADELHTHFQSTSLSIGELTIPTWQNLMKEMDLVISVDSCALHLAGLAKIPTMSIFGPSSAKIYNPRGKTHLAIQGACPYNETFVKRCSRLRTCSTGACMKELSSAELYRRFQEWFKSEQSLSKFM